MKALFSVVSLLVVLAVVASLANRQLKAVQPSAGLPQPASGTVVDQSRQLQDKARNDVAGALSQGAAATREADK